MLKDERYNFLLLAFLLIAITVINVLRVQLLDNAIINGILIEGGIADALWYYLIGCVIDVGAALLIASSPGWRIKGASLPIFWCLIGAGFLHAIGFICWSVGVVFEQYLIISRALLVLEFMFLAFGGYGTIRRYRHFPGANSNLAYSDSGSVDRHPGPENNIPR